MANPDRTKLRVILEHAGESVIVSGVVPGIALDVYDNIYDGPQSAQDVDRVEILSHTRGTAPRQE